MRFASPVSASWVACSKRSSSSCLRSVMSSTVPDTPGRGIGGLRDAHVDPAHCAIGTDDAVCVRDIGVAAVRGCELVGGELEIVGMDPLGEGVERGFGVGADAENRFQLRGTRDGARCRGRARSCRGAPTAGRRRRRRRSVSCACSCCLRSVMSRRLPTTKPICGSSTRLVTVSSTQYSSPLSATTRNSACGDRRGR